MSNDGLISNAAIRTVFPEDISALKERAIGSPLQRDRICLHNSVEDAIQEMVIAFTSKSYVQPHRHPSQTESFHIIEGECVVVLFDDSGAVLKSIPMSPITGSHACLYRLSSSIWHTVLPLSPFVVLHEVVKGPFSKTSAEFAPWAPSPGDTAAVEAWCCRLRQDLLIPRPMEPSPSTSCHP